MSNFEQDTTLVVITTAIPAMEARVSHRCPTLYSIVQNEIQQGFMHMNVTVVLNKAKAAKPVHEEIDA